MRQALAHLVDRGLLVRKRGVGTHVVPSPVRRTLELTSRAPRTDVLTVRTTPAPPRVAAELGIVDGTEVVYLERLRWADHEPLALMRNWLPVGLAPLDTSVLRADTRRPC